MSSDAASHRWKVPSPGRSCVTILIPPPQPCLPFKSVTRMKWNFGAKKNVPLKVTDDKTLFLTPVNQNFRHRATKTTHLICVACYFVKSEQDVPGNTWEQAACTVFPKHTCRRLSVLLQAHRDPPCTDAVLDISLLVSVPNISATFQISRTWIFFFFWQILTLYSPLLYFQCLRNPPNETNGFGEDSLGERDTLSADVSCGLETLMSFRMGPAFSVPSVEGLSEKETSHVCQPFLGTKERCVAVIFLMFFSCGPWDPWLYKKWPELRTPAPTEP